MCYHIAMTISLRNLGPEVEQAIAETSRREQISLNKATQRLLEESLCKPAMNSDFDDLAGSWSPAEADQFDAALLKMRQADALDWATTE